MLKFHVHWVAVFLALCVPIGGISFALYKSSHLIDPLLPREQSEFPWKVTLTTDEIFGGTSEITQSDASSSFGFNYLVKTEGIEYPFISYSIDFTDSARPTALADLTRYDKLKIHIECVPDNILSLAVRTFDEAITNLADPGTYRVAETFFFCGGKSREVTIELKRLEIPEWWFREHKVKYSKRSYHLDKVASISFHNSQQSPKGIQSSVKVTAASLHGRDWRYIYAAIGLNLVIWSIFAVWFVRRRTAALIEEITEKLQRERPLIAYQQLPDDTKQDREKNTVLRYMATNYAKQDLSVEMAVAELGINRTKINAILKDELGLTFSSYVNRLRLTEAARLLLEKESSVAEIGYLVGYGNASYFTTVFKKEYGCTPGDFRKLMVEKPVT
jgi:Response regulator containing CheY-like receiver domain and AraC-type DNA-binding domain